MNVEDFYIEFHYTDGDIGAHGLTDFPDDFTIKQILDDWSNDDKLSHIVIKQNEELKK